MKIRLLSIAIVLIVFTIALMNMIFTINKHDSLLVAERGILDLTKQEFSKNEVVKLDGEWEFYPGKLLDPEDFKNNKATEEKVYVKVPARWTGYTVEGEKIPPYHSATYRLRIILKDFDGIYGIKTSNIRLSNRIYINGDLVGNSGIPMENRSYSPENTPYVSYVALTDNLIEVIVHVANYDYASGGGIINSIYFGSDKAVSGIREKALFYDWTVFTALLVIGIYFFGLFILRRKDLHLFFFSISAIFFSLFTASHGEKILYILFPDINYSLFSGIQYFVPNISALSFVLYFYYSYQKLYSKLMVKVLATIFSILIFFGIVFPISINSKLDVLLTIIHGFYLFYLIYILILGVFLRKEGAIFNVVSLVFLIIYVVTNLSNLFGFNEVNIMPPVEPFVIILMQALLMAKRFSNAYKKNEELSQRLIVLDKLKDEFLAKTSHEFKTPLHGIINIIQSLRDGVASRLTKDEAEKFTSVITIAKRLSALINDILDLSKLKEGKLKIELTEIDARSTVGFIFEVFSFIKAEKNVVFVNSILDELPYIKADENRFRQIIINLVDNALKHTNKGFIEVSAIEKGNFIEISVRDTGSGIENDKLDAIFIPFEQVDALQNGKNGIGLGLSIVKQLVELQGGKIWVKSEPGSGSTFTFTLPAVKREKNMGARSPVHLIEEEMFAKTKNMSFETPYKTDGKSEFTILVVDDDFSNLRILIDTLSSENYAVVAVKNGIEALEQIEAGGIDLVILDIMMPGISGYEVCMKIREIYGMAELPVIILTAAIYPEDMYMAFQAGANDFLNKPLEMSELKLRVKSLLMMKKSSNIAVNMEIALLQAQIKPHFLYNVLNTMMSLSYTDIEKSRKLTADFADFLRRSFDFGNISNLVSLNQELSLVKSYLEIEKIRFKDRLKIEMNIEDHIDLILPPLTIQPIVENAVQHGIMKNVEGGTVKISASKQNGLFVIQVEDDGIGMSEERRKKVLYGETESKSVALKNINKRMKRLFGTELVIESVWGKGTKVILQIPEQTGSGVRR